MKSEEKLRTNKHGSNKFTSLHSERDVFRNVNEFSILFRSKCFQNTLMENQKL